MYTDKQLQPVFRIILFYSRLKCYINVYSNILLLVQVYMFHVLDGLCADCFYFDVCLMDILKVRMIYTRITVPMDEA